MAEYLESLGLVLMLLGFASFVFFGFRKKEFGKAMASLAVALLGLGLAWSALAPVLTYVPPEAATPAATVEVQAGRIPLLEGAKIVSTETQVYAKQVTPMICIGMEDLIFWRELRVFSATKVDEFGRETKSFFSTVTLNIENKGDEPLEKVLVKETLPPSVAVRVDELMDFTIAPKKISQGSVVVEWLFDHVEPGEVKKASYTVEKKLEKSVLEQYGAPNVLVESVEGTPAPAAGAERKSVGAGAGPESALPLVGVGIVVVILVAVTYFFTKKKEETPPTT